MLFRELLSDELTKQSESFKKFVSIQQNDLDAYLKKLARLCEKSAAEIGADLYGKDNVGAIPSDELDRAERFSFPFSETWTNHEAARRWAAQVLQNRTTFAADGSQMFAEAEVSMPVGAIQIGWFENPHDADLRYEKSASFKILPPDLLLAQDEPVVAETKVGQFRFDAEIDKAMEFLHKKQGWRARDEKMPLAFYDGTLLLSLSKTDLQEAFTNKLVELAKLSRETRVPLVGYVDRSYARDLLALLNAFDAAQKTTNKTLDDVSLLRAATENFPQTLKNWGERTVFCYSKRRGLSAFNDPATGRSIVGFVYLQTTAENAPARLDIPAWIYEDGLLEEVLNVVRAECVVGLGYPYALETADQTAVITMRDREIFLRALQDFARREKLAFSVSRKAASKVRRR